MTRDETQAAKERNWTWLCNKCEDAEKSANAPPPTLDPIADIEEKAAGMKSFTRESLRIMSWNADGLSTKAGELIERLNAMEVDICAVQETKFRAGNRTPAFPGYVSVRADRDKRIGGGLLFLIKNTVVFEKLQDISRDGTETSSIRVRMDKKKWLTLTNVYIPPANSTTNAQLCAEIIPAMDNSLICGDFNAHSDTWDFIQPEDARGEELEVWATTKELTPLNDELQPTRHNRTTGNGSSPDVVFCGKEWLSACHDGWSIGEDLGSDHLPMMIVMNNQVKHQPVFGTRARWRTNEVDWSQFTDEVDREMAQFPTNRISLLNRIRRFAGVLTRIAAKVVRKVKPGKKTRVYLTPAVKKAVSKRNRARRKISSQRKEWLDACMEVKEKLLEAKQEKWKEVVEGAMNADDERKVWNFIRSLNGAPASNAPNQTINVKGRTLTSNQKKADAFIEHYAEVSSLDLSKVDREERRAMKKMLQTPTVDDENGAPLTMDELDKALAAMKAKGAPGPDDIPPTFLKALGPIAKAELLDIFNESLLYANVPQIWRLAFILPLLKLNKPASQLASYRPISLTSCVVKLLERMLANRITSVAETKGMLSKLQAGFRKGRCCEDQILKIVQGISDGYQAKPRMRRSVLVLLDYSRAYDTVWRERLLLNLHDKGIPMTLVRWIASFLEERHAKVRFGDTLSKNRRIRQGVPQGSVLSPLLFLFYINNLAELLEKELTSEGVDAEVAMFADDVSILARGATKEEATRTAQKLVDVVTSWSDEWKLCLNTGKSQVTLFTNDSGEASAKPKIFINGSQIPFEKYPKLLGVTLDRALSFNKHVEITEEQANNKIKMIAALSFTDWGWKKDDLMKIYNTFVKSKIFYAGAAWMSYLFDTTINRLQVVQNKAMRKMTGIYKTAPVESLLKECRMVSISTEIDRQCLTSYEKALRLPEDHPRREVAEQSVTHRTARSSWRAHAAKLGTLLPATALTRKELPLFKREPWKERKSLTINANLVGVKSKSDPPEVIRDAAMHMITNSGADIVIYTDGSADAGMLKGGAAAVITEGCPESPEVREVIKVRGAQHTSSYEEEVEAMRRAVDWVNMNATEGVSILIVTDSQSLCIALCSQNDELDEIWNLLDECDQRMTIQWVPGHAGIEGNELADQHAKEATKLPDPPRGVSFNSAKAMINRAIGEKKPVRASIATAYSNLSRTKETLITSREEQRCLAQMRSTHHKAFGDYQQRLHADHDPLCHRCYMTNDSVPHFMTECPATMEERAKLFQTRENNLGVLTSHPEECVALAKKFGVMPC